MILFYNPQWKNRLSPKLQTKLNNVVYRVQKANRTRTKMKAAHIERLAKYEKRDKDISQPCLKLRVNKTVVA